MPAGRPRSKPVARCPKVEHKGATTYASGTYATKTGTRQRYQCVPLTGEGHTFSVVLTEETPARASREPAPACPQGHEGRVWRNGKYGTRTATPRQSYRCVPTDPDVRPHKFTAVLPRDHIHPGNQTCAACHEHRGIHRGETAVARRHTWSTATVVRALEKLASGQSYSAVSKFALEVEGTGQRTRNGPGQAQGTAKKRAGHRWHIAADWCELFSPVIWEDLVTRMDTEVEQCRAAGGRVVWLVDSTSFVNRKRRRPRGQAPPAGQVVPDRPDRFALLSVAEQLIYPDRSPSKARLRVVRALPNRTSQAWQLVMAEPGYAPDFVVTDADSGQLGALGALFGQVVVQPCTFHLRRNLVESLDDLPAAHTGPRSDRRLHPDLRAHLAKMTNRDHIQDRIEVAAWWDGWAVLHHRLGLPTDRVARQRDRYEQMLVAASDDLRAHPGVPMSVGALEAIQNELLRPSLARRAAVLGNIERCNALLDLIVAGSRGVFNDHNKVAELLRRDVLTDEGHSTPLRWVEDAQPKRSRYSSLRDPALVAALAEQAGIL